MNKCIGCRKLQDVINFTCNNKILKKCITCRTNAKLWRNNNKERVSLYNKMTNIKKKNNINKSLLILYAKNITNEENEWVKYNSQLDAAKKLNLQPSNINKVLSGSIKHTGNYKFKYEEEEHIFIEEQNWEEIKLQNNYVETVKGCPAKHRILHETINNIVGKVCCSCKQWSDLTNYGYSSTHWDNLRNNCKQCLVKYRENVVKPRYKTDPAFKISSVLRARLNKALKAKNAKKSNKTFELVGCTISFLMGYIESKFTQNMSWENHGVYDVNKQTWHLDHIIPCASFNLLEEEEQKKCFHYTNLQPLWAKDNLSKGCKIINNDQSIQ